MSLEVKNFIEQISSLNTLMSVLRIIATHLQLINIGSLLFVIIFGYAFIDIQDTSIYKKFSNAD